MSHYSDDSSNASYEREPTFESDLEATLKFNPLRVVDDTDPNDRALHPTYPVTFYDRHIDPNLALRSIQTVPLAKILSMICRTETAALLSDDEIVKPEYFPPDEHEDGEELECSSAQSLASYYEEALIDSFTLLPEKQYIRPQSDVQGGILQFDIFHDDDPRVPPRQFSLRASLRIGGERRDLDKGDLKLAPQTENSLTKAQYASLLDLARHSPELAIWEFYLPNSSGEKIIKARYDEVFTWAVTRTTGYLSPLSPNTRPVDGDIEKLLNAGLHKPRVLRTRKPAIGVIPATALPYLESTKKRSYRVDYKPYLQHVWGRAVANDATFIVLSCGTYERIGIRHRASQTLFITEPFKPEKCQNPAYGELHLGLHYAILKDALERQKLRQSKAPPLVPPVKKKRSIDEVDTPCVPARKRAKPNANGRTETRSENVTKAIRQALSSRDLVLVSVGHDIHHSPSPSSFIRVGASCANGNSDIPFNKPSRSAKYTPNKYFRITLQERLGAGALADAHCGTVEVDLNGRNVSYPVVMKMVFSRHRSQRKKLEKEHAVYRHLADAGAYEGILNCYGMFEDTETGTLALILDNGGMNLTDREMDKGKVDEIRPTRIEGEALMRAIRSIHAANVCHKDIRSDNILVDNAGAAYIIDFDRAKIGPQPDGGFDREMAIMQELVDKGLAVKQSTQYTSSHSFY